MCRVELLLMRRGVPELLSHFKTDLHLVKEHRTRLETPGVPLCDRSEKTLTGNTLQEAKRVAKETYPIAPQLDACRLLVGQDRLSDFSITSNPSEDVISQIGILKYGLRHGGNVDTVAGMWYEMVRLFPGNSQESTLSCNRERLFVNIRAFPLFSVRSVSWLSVIFLEALIVFMFRELMQHCDIVFLSFLPTGHILVFPKQPV